MTRPFDGSQEAGEEEDDDCYGVTSDEEGGEEEARPQGVAEVRFLLCVVLLSWGS